MLERVMSTNKRFFIGEIIIGTVLLFAFQFKIYGDVIQPVLFQILGLDMTIKLTPVPVLLASFLLIGLFISFWLFQVLYGAKVSTFMRLSTLLYGVIFITLVMLKSIGVQGLNLDFTQIVTDFSISPSEMFMNIVLFIPLGVMIKRVMKRFTLSIVAGLVLSIIIENIQYVFHLGIFDVIDIAMNFAGIVLGVALSKYWYSIRTYPSFRKFFESLN
jgi:glycopeptide antibiotics resistance protein